MIALFEVERHCNPYYFTKKNHILANQSLSNIIPPAEFSTKPRSSIISWLGPITEVLVELR